MCFFFFFQAEDGIRDADVTGVQTCALPISTSEAVSHRQLNYSFAEFSRHLAERSAVRVVVRNVPVWMIQHVERLGAELHLLTPGDRHALADPEIEIPRGRIAKHVSRLDAEGTDGRLGKRGRIEPCG